MNENHVLLNGDCIEMLKLLPNDSIDSLVTDPPAGISFMGKEWDNDRGGREAWIAWMKEVMQECLRVLKPGAHGLVWAIPRTSHWTATALEDAGFEIRDRVSHLFGSGFPKSHSCKNIGHPELGSALKPACEDWWLVRKPLENGLTIDKNVLKWGTGALQIDASRIGSAKGRWPSHTVLSHNEDCVEVGTKKVNGNHRIRHKPSPTSHFGSGSNESVIGQHEGIGNPDGTETVSAWECTEGCAVRMLDEQSGFLRSVGKYKDPNYQSIPGSFGGGKTLNRNATANDGGGGASRFFYCAKASKREKGEGNTHPTIKSLKLMQYLIRMITPPNGVVLDPFMGSGSTGVAATQSGFSFIGIEKEEEYLKIAEKRII